MAKWKLKDFVLSTRRRLDELDDSYISDAEIVEYINAGVFDLGTELRLETYTVLDGANLKSFPLPADLDEFKYVFANGSRIESTTIDKRNETGLRYYLFGGQLHFTQPVTSPEVFYHRLPRSMSNNEDETDVPEKYQHLVTLYSFARCLQKDQEMGLASAILDEYRNLKYEMATEIHNKQSLSGRDYVDTSYWNDYGGADYF